MRRAVAILGALGLAGAILGAGLWMAGRQAPAPGAADTAEREVVREDPEALVCDEARGNPQLAAPDAWPLTFAGLWIDEKERMLYVAFTERAEEKVAKLAECFPKRSFTPVTFEHSERQLRGVLDRMLADRSAIDAGRLTLPGLVDARYSFGLDTMNNVITVWMEQVTPETIATFTSRYGDFVLVEERDPGGTGYPEPTINTEAVSCEDALWGPDAIARGVWPETFGGAWARSGTMFLAFTEEAEKKVAELAECFPSTTLVPVTVEHTLLELDAIVERMFRERGMILEGTLSIPGIDTDRYDMMVWERENAVMVLLEESDPDLMAALRRRYGDVLVFREPGGGAG